MKEDLKIYYIYHSCFAVESKNYLLVFDYYQSPAPTREDDIQLQTLVSTTVKKVIVFSSHGHHDHFNPEIFTWDNRYKPIIYILSDDISLQHPYPNCYRLHEDESLSVEGLDIHTYGSTDLGVSYLVEFDGHMIFHAGDLNWWYWKDDTPDEEKFMRESFQNIIKKMDQNKKIDFAFFPVDPRLEEYAYLGGEYFVDKLRPKYLVPMHFDEEYKITDEFKERISPSGTHGITINRKNQRIYP